MFTFQVLDRGESFFVPLGAEPATIGSSGSATIRLTGPGILPVHARVEPFAAGLKLVVVSDDATAAPVRVNGEEVGRVGLVLGDRVEIGDAVLVLGQRVARANTPDDVLEPIARATRRERTESGGGLPRWLLATVGVGILGIVVGAILVQGAQKGPPRFELERITSARRVGDFEQARAVLAGLRRDWVGTDPERASEVDRLAAEVERTEQSLAALRAEVVAAAAAQTTAEQHAFLRERQASGDPAVAEAARILLAQLPELRAEGIAQAPPPTTGGPQRPVAQVAPPETGAGDPGKRAEAPPGVAPEPPALPASLTTELQRLAAAGEHAQALELVNQALASAASLDESRELRDQLQSVRTNARAEMEALLASAREDAAAGRLEQALTRLRAPAQRFPATGELATLHREIDRLQGELDAQRATESVLASAPSAGTAAGETREAALSEIADLLAAQRKAELVGDLAGAAATLREAGARVESRDVLFGALLREKAADLDRVVEFAAGVRGRVEQRPLELELATGPAQLTGFREQWLQVTTGLGEQEITWLDVPSSELEKLSGGLPAEAQLGAAVLAYRAGDRPVAERLLARVFDAQKGLQPEIQGIVRRGRGDRIDPLGYVLVKGEFVPRRVIEAEKASRQIEQRLARALSQQPAQRDKLLEEILAGGPDALDALVLALERLQISVAERIDKSPAKKGWEKLAQARDELDAARARAKALIFDEQKYFYPYKPPAVDPDKAAEYPAVQREVDELVAGVRKLWQAKSWKVTVPKKLREDEAAFRWVTKVLADFGERAPDVEARVAWVGSLPERELTLQNFARDAAERAQFELWDRIDGLNQKLSMLLAPGERENVAITNEYRRMFGHRPLAVSHKLARAAREHSNEMSRLGYFGHFSPTPGRRTPMDRMRAEGYTHPIGENCALADGAQAAHEGWTHSSGHHRNLLMPSHTEFGVGGDGRNWTQNFGSGDDYAREQGF